jgi:hypothetical protein
MDSTIRNSTRNSKNGRYVRGGTTEVSGYALEWWDKVDAEKDTTDTIYVMEAKYEGRPDLLGLAFYDDPGLWWVICQYNGIIDPMTELVEGKTLLIPSEDKVSTAYKATSSNIGGVTSTRTA